MAVLVGGASLIAGVATAGAYEPVGSDFRVSTVGIDTDHRDGVDSAIAYNPTANEYLGHLGGGPKEVLDKSKVKLKFVSDETSSSFECRLKGKQVKRKLKKFKPCSSPAKYKKLQLGRKKFEVRATDAAGNTDPTPATWAWKVEKSGLTDSSR